MPTAPATPRPYAAGLALALLVAVLLALCPGLRAGTGGHDTGERTVATAPAGIPGCGSGTGGGERDAQPATPPRGASAHEPPPVPYVPHCAALQPARDLLADGPAVPGRPPPGPRSPEELSILRM